MNEDNSNQTLQFMRNSGLRRSDFEKPPSRGDVLVVVIACVAILLWVVGVI